MAGERILVVDDEEIVKNLAARVLGIAGYETDTAQNGQEALNKLKRAHEDRTDPPYDCVLTDISMPLVRGDEVIKAALSYGLAAVAMTGDPNDARDAEKAGPYKVLSKPISNIMVVLPETIRAALDAKTHAKDTPLEGRTDTPYDHSTPGTD